MGINCSGFLLFYIIEMRYFKSAVQFNLLNKKYLKILIYALKFISLLFHMLKYCIIKGSLNHKKEIMSKNLTKNQFNFLLQLLFSASLTWKKTSAHCISGHSFPLLHSLLYCECLSLIL